MLKFVSGAFAIAALSLHIVSASSAQAQTAAANVPNITPPTFTASEDDKLEFFGALTLTTDSRGQGFTSNDEDPSISGDLGVIYKNFYLGLSATLVDLGQNILPNGATQDVGRAALTYYAGYVNIWRETTYDITISYATFPGAKDSGAELDYWEGSVGASRILFSDVKGGVRVYYAPDFTAGQGRNWTFELTLEKPLPKFWRLTPLLTGTVGYQEGDEDRGNFDYWFWEAGVELTVTKHWNFDLRYHDSADVPFSCSNLCGPRFVASTTFEF
ncbi:MAG: TorF family putative porin [Alphaproteobacteria bacterium]|nr:TorF family putative porin [Alphaproteobacteria bacterium]